MTDPTTAGSRTVNQWRLQYENDNPHRERNQTDRVTEAGPGRYRHELTSASEAAVKEYQRVAESRGATIIGIQRRDVTTAYGPWEGEL